MKNKKDISVRMFQWWWNIDDLNVEQIIEHYTRLLNFVKDNNAEDAKSYVDKSPEEVIQEVEEILGRYTIGSGWMHAEEIEEGGESAIRERDELRKVVAHLKKQYKKYYSK